MKLKKEQIVLIVVLLLVGWLAYDTLTSEFAPSKKRRRSRGGAVAEHDLTILEPVFLGREDPVWDTSGRNVYRAPSEHSPLPPVNLPVPPRPSLPTSPPSTVPGVSPYHRVGMIRPIAPVGGVELPPREERIEDEEVPEASEEGEDTASELIEDANETEEDVLIQDAEKVSKKKKRTVKKILGLRDRLAKQAQEKVEQARAERDREIAREERRESLDKINWQSGEIWYGEVVNDAEVKPGAAGYDRFRIKLRIDEIRNQTQWPRAKVDEALRDRELEIEFRRWNERTEKLDRKQKVSPTNVASLEFAPTAANIFEVGRRRIAPGDAEGHLALVQEVIAAEEHERAKSHLLRMLDQGHTGRDVYVSLADSSRMSFDYDSEMRAVKEGLQKHPGDAELLASLGELYSLLGLNNLAISTFEKALDADSRSRRANARLGRHVLDAGYGGRANAAEAVGHLTKAMRGRIEPPSARRAIQMDLARANLAAGQLSDAASGFESILNAHPAYVPALMGDGAVAYARGQYAEAKARFTEALERQPDSGAAYYNLALCSLAEADWKAARDGFHDAMDADPLLTARARCALGYLNERIGNPVEAEVNYAAASEADPADPEVLLWQGRGFLLMQDYEKAHETLSRAQTLLPDQFDVLAALSEATFHMQRYADSLRYIDAALALNPESGTLLVRRAQTLARLKRFDDAKRCLDLSKQKEHTDEVELSLAYYYYVEGNHKEALKRFRSVERSLEQQDGRPLALYARKYAGEIEENLAKKVWTDHFNRVSTGRDLLRGWRGYAPGSGVSISLLNNRVSLAGKQRNSEVPSCVFQQRPGRLFVSYEASLLAEANAPFTAGIGLFTFRKNVGDQNPYVDMFSSGIAYEGIMVAKTPEGRIAWRRVARYELGRWTPTGETWPSGENGEPGTVQLGIAVKDPRKGTYDILVNGAVVAPGVEVKGLARANKDLQLWAFTQAEIDKRVDLKVDDVRIITRDAPKRRRKN